MPGTHEGGLKTKKTNLKNNKNYYKEIGRMGGLVHCRKGFATNPKLAREAGRIGGLLSRRGPKQ